MSRWCLDICKLLTFVVREIALFYCLFLLVILHCYTCSSYLTHNTASNYRDATLPKYMMREFGENTPKGKVYAINPLMIIILVPIITAATSSVDPLIMIHIGTYVSALSVFFLAFSTSLMFVITLSIGESLWSPRLYDYTTSIAEEGREGNVLLVISLSFCIVIQHAHHILHLILQVHTWH